MANVSIDGREGVITRALKVGGGTEYTVLVADEDSTRPADPGPTSALHATVLDGHGNTSATYPVPTEEEAAEAADQSRAQETPLVDSAPADKDEKPAAGTKSAPAPARTARTSAPAKAKEADNK